jgi:hypothetical protein
METDMLQWLITRSEDTSLITKFEQGDEAAQKANRDILMGFFQHKTWLRSACVTTLAATECSSRYGTTKKRFAPIISLDPANCNKCKYPHGPDVFKAFIMQKWKWFKVNGYKYGPTGKKKNALSSALGTLLDSKGAPNIILVT